MKALKQLMLFFMIVIIANSPLCETKIIRIGVIENDKGHSIVFQPPKRKVTAYALTRRHHTLLKEEGFRCPKCPKKPYIFHGEKYWAINYYWDEEKKNSSSD